MNAAHHNSDALQRDADRYARLLEICPNAIAVCKSGEIILCNRALQQLVRRTSDDLIGRPAEDLLAAEVREPTLRKLREMKAARVHHQATCETRMLRSDGGEILADVSIDEFELSGSADEVLAFRPHPALRTTGKIDRDQLLQLTHMHRMAVFGELTASLLHELGQPLTAAHGASEILAASLKGNQISDEAARSAQIVAESTFVAAKRFQQIWEFVRHKKPTSAKARLTDVLTRAIDLTKTAIRHAGIEIEAEQNEVESIAADSSLLETAIAGLLARSMTALSGHSAGTKRISIKLSQPESTRIEISISHNGDTLPSEQQLLQQTSDSTAEIPAALPVGVVRSIMELNGGVLSVEKPSNAFGVRYRLLFPI